MKGWQEGRTEGWQEGRMSRWRYGRIAGWQPLKVPKREIFDRSDFPDFYTLKSLRVGKSERSNISRLGTFKVAGFTDWEER